MSSILRRLSRSIQPNTLPIIRVHGVFDLDIKDSSHWNPLGKHCHLSQLKSSLEKISKDFKAISLHDLIQHCHNNTWPKEKSFTLTFDDGYAGFEKLILPTLERYECPASFFPVIDFVDRTVMWPDQVEEVILSSDHFSSPDGELKPPQEAHKLWVDHLNKLSRDERQNMLDKYFTLTENHELAPQHKAVSWDELRRLSQHPLISIGNHTLSHPELSKNREEMIAGEIVGGAERLRHELGSCDLFSYPNGYDDGHSEIASKIIKESDHLCALVNREALFSPQQDLFQMPRFLLSSNNYNSTRFYNGIWGISDLKNKVFS